MGRNETIEYALPQVKKPAVDEHIEYEDTVTVMDSDWVMNAFMVPLADVYREDTRYRYRTPANVEVMDSSLGGHIAINMPYSYTRYADVPYKGRIATRERSSVYNSSWKLGAGRYWCEAHNETARNRVAYMQFGVPKFTSAFSFYTNAANFAETIVAREGRTPAFYDVGKTLGEAAVLIYFPAFFLVAKLASLASDLILGTSIPKYYTMKPTMHTYWRTANTILTSLMVERGIYTPILDIDKRKSYLDKEGSRFKIDKKSLDDFHALAPEIMGRSGVIDIMGIAGRYQILINEQIERESKLLSKLSLMDSYASLDKDIENWLLRDEEETRSGAKTKGYKEYLESVERLQIYKEKQVQQQAVATADSSVDPDTLGKPDDLGFIEGVKTFIADYLEDMKKYFKADIFDGASNAVFYVDYVGSSSDTFSNSIKDIPAKSAINSVGGAIRDIRFTMSDGNLVGDAVDEVIKAGRDFAMGQIEGFSMGLSNIISGLMGGVSVEFLKMWEDSSAQVATHTFKMDLGGPYGDSLSQVFDIDIPLAMILAGCLPLKTGKASYTSPFLCSLYVRGIANISEGLIRSVTVTTGEGQLGHTDLGSSKRAVITFEVVDLSEVMPAPVTPGYTSSFEFHMDDESMLGRYLAKIGGRSYHTNKYLSRRILSRVSKYFMSRDTFYSPENMAMALSNTAVGAMLNAVAPDRSGISLFDPIQ